MSSNVQEVRREIRELKREINDVKKEVQIYRNLLFSTMSLMDKTGLTNTTQIRRMITLLNRLRMAYLSVQAARMAAGDPLAWAMAGIAVTTVGVDIYTEVTSH
jgi:hypothetical protein